MAFVPCSSEPDMIVLITIIFIFIAIFLYRKWLSFRVINWPFFGMMFQLLLHLHHLHDSATSILKLCNGTFMFKGPWFANMYMLITSDPTNIHHVLSKNFQNYPKGAKFRKIFDILGDGIINSDDELWEIQRKTLISILKHPNFHTLLEITIRKKVEKGLLPLLHFMARKEIDLQEILQRFGFDFMCLLLFDHDPESLSIDLPFVPCEKAFTDAEEAILWRHVLPERIWKLQRRFGIGKEKKMTEARKAFDEFIYKYLSRMENVNEEPWLLTSVKRGLEGHVGSSGDSRKLLKDVILTLLVAGRDTTSATLSWFMYLLTQNPGVEDKIREEIEKNLGGGEWKTLAANKLAMGGLVYLHGCLCETLRLYPPVGLEHKVPVERDMLPSGHVVDEHTQIIMCFYSMGRMKKIWGEDCNEFRPERWFSEGGGIKHQPSYKFTAFNAGPRSCLGKEMAFFEMKMVAASIIYNYHVEVVEGHEVCASDSVVLQIKYGLKVHYKQKAF